MRADAAEHLVTETGLKPLVDARRLDATDALQSARELVEIKKVLYYTQFPEFMADKLCPVSNKANTGAKNVGYDIMTPTGVAQIVDDDAQDTPVANIKKEQTTQPVVTIKLAVEWNIQDLREATLSQLSGLSANYSFTEEKTRAVLIGIRRKEEDIFVQGDSKYSVPGFCNNSNLSAVTLPNTGSWGSMTAEHIVANINAMLNAISIGSKNVFQANTVLLPPAIFDLIASKPFSGTNGTAVETVLSFIRRTRKEAGINVEFINYPYLEELKSGSNYRIIAYKKDPMVLNQEIPQPLETFGPISNDGGQTFRVVVRERHAGVQLRYPVAARYALAQPS